MIFYWEICHSPQVKFELFQIGSKQVPVEQMTSVFPKSICWNRNAVVVVRLGGFTKRVAIQNWWLNGYFSFKLGRCRRLDVEQQARYCQTVHS